MFCVGASVMLFAASLSAEEIEAKALVDALAAQGTSFFDDLARKQSTQPAKYEVRIPVPHGPQAVLVGIGSVELVANWRGSEQSFRFVSGGMPNMQQLNQASNLKELLTALSNGNADGVKQLAAKASVEELRDISFRKFFDSLELQTTYLANGRFVFLVCRIEFSKKSREYEKFDPWLEPFSQNAFEFKISGRVELTFPPAK